MIFSLKTSLHKWLGKRAEILRKNIFPSLYSIIRLIYSFQFKKPWNQCLQTPFLKGICFSRSSALGHQWWLLALGPQSPNFFPSLNIPMFFFSLLCSLSSPYSINKQTFGSPRPYHRSQDHQTQNGADLRRKYLNHSHLIFWPHGHVKNKIKVMSTFL